MGFRTRGHKFELSAIKYDSTNEILLFDHDFVCFLVLSHFVFYCTRANVTCIKLLLTYLLT